MGREAVIDAVPYGAGGRPRRGQGLAPPGRAHPGLVAGPARASGRGLGRLGRLQGRARRHLHAVRGRSGATRSSPSRPSACRSTDGRRRQSVFAEINAWWRANQAAGKASLLLGYALGKSQRLLSGLDPSIGPILTHGAVEKLNRAYREAGVALPPTAYAGAGGQGQGLEPVDDRRPPLGAGDALGPQVRPGLVRDRLGLDDDPGDPAAEGRRPRASSSPTTSTGPACSARSRRPGRAGSWSPTATPRSSSGGSARRGSTPRSLATRYEGERDDKGADDEPTRSRRRAARRPLVKDFAELYAALDETTRTGEKVEALTRYFARAPPADAAWAVYFLIGRKPKQAVPSKKLRELGGRGGGRARLAVRRVVRRRRRRGRDRRAAPADARAVERPPAEPLGRGPAPDPPRVGRGGPEGGDARGLGGRWTGPSGSSGTS